ncbi:hypothetical protein RHMOL_Rhmol02G0173800 [Rhododendron molle]|uniref:Uncharacterized protein n=1 Tax=Rhododendron molle TaxID=49168 RepID=A0ACC0PSV4_RHOML|nr:hypothetical protein RHMOL_Rhmol02G0173800 [Rhododendron molle]
MEESLKLEAEERVHHLQGNVYQFERQIEKVQNSNPNPKILFNACENPYVEGDPNMGYLIEDTKPRNTPSHLVQKTVPGSFTPELGQDPKSTSHKPPLSASHAQPQFAPTPQHQFNSNIHTKPPQAHQPNPKSNTGQNKPKPKNWVSLLQSQSPSLDMKIEYIPDLQKGKEALVEIDLELTEVGKWNRYLINARTSKQPGLLHTKSTKAKICIEISADQELPNEVIVSVQGETVVVPIELNSKFSHPMCSYCHVFGHSTSKCVKHTVIVPPLLPKSRNGRL